MKIPAITRRMMANVPLMTCVKYNTAITTAAAMRKIRSVVPIFFFINSCFFMCVTKLYYLFMLAAAIYSFKSSIVFLPRRTMFFCSMVRNSLLMASLWVCSSSAICWWVMVIVLVLVAFAFLLK